MNAAVAAGLLTHRRLRQQGAARPTCTTATRPQEADALALVPQVIDLVAAILGNELQWSEGEAIESTIFRALAGPKALGRRGRSVAGDLRLLRRSHARHAFVAGRHDLVFRRQLAEDLVGRRHHRDGRGPRRRRRRHRPNPGRVLAKSCAGNAGGSFEANGVANRRPQGPGRLHHQQSHRRLRRREGPHPRLRPPLLRPLRPRSPRRRAAEHRQGLGPGRRVLHVGQRDRNRS